MPQRSAAVSIENNFSKGLITEATAMNYPENSVAEADNCVFLKNGKVIRRWGLDFEDDYQVTTFEALGIMGEALAPEDYYDSLAFTEFEWNSVSNNGNLSLMVVQVGNMLVFFEVDGENKVSANRKSFTVNLSSFQTTVPFDDEGQYVAAVQCSFASGFGTLFVTHPLCNPFYVTYSAATDTISTAPITLSVRDFERLNDSLAIDNRPSTNSNLHKYNLYNQGWYIDAKNATPAVANVLTYWDGARTDFPSNADIWWVNKNSSNQFDSAFIDTTPVGNSPAPNGHYIYNAFSYGRNTALSVTGLPDPSTTYRPRTTAFYSGRVWYAGVPDQGYNSKIYFSKVVEGTSDFGTCYQAGDPTSEHNSDLLEIDGGVIVIPDLGNVYRLLPVGSSLLIFASNGIWKIVAPNDVFAANSFGVQKISSASISAPYSVVIAEGLPFWWDKAGIYTIQIDQTSGKETVINISEATIQSLINAIPDENLNYVKGAYNNIDKNIHWIYRSEDAESLTESFKYDKLIVLNLSNQSFSPQTISSSVPSVAGLLFTSQSNNDALLTERGASVVKFLTIGNFGTDDTEALTISQFNRSDYGDWESYGGAPSNFSSYFITGYRVRGDLLKKFQSNYMVVIMEQEDDSSCLIQGVWDYSNSPSTGHYTSSQQLFRSNTTKDYSRRKIKIRGNGYSLQFKFRSETGMPFTIVGWTTSDTGNVIP
jgi:hypothetical protein